ncbi:hypothetical protein [Sphingomonas sp.]|uniref:hypothetical protein n=1 Tax=Sphingomonas sp. TaxID=28214 RepID=UPI002FD881AB
MTPTAKGGALQTAECGTFGMADRGAVRGVAQPIMKRGHPFDGTVDLICFCREHLSVDVDIATRAKHVADVGQR